MSLNAVCYQSSQIEDSLLASFEIDGVKPDSAFSTAEDIDSEPLFTGIVGQSAALRHVLQLVEMVAPSDPTVLRLGETGTGKEVIGQELHHRSGGQKQPFVTLNGVAIPS